MPQPINFKREVTIELTRRLREKAKFMQVLVGPRQIGKTTAVMQALDELRLPFHYATADLPAPPEPAWIFEEWETARRLAHEKGEAILALDEIQKIFRWSEVVKKLRDEDQFQNRPLQVVLLGSSSLLMQKGLTESLAGRFELLRCPHWQFEECRTCFGWNVDQYLYFGGYPAAASLIGEEKRWAAFVRDSLIETAISKDILMLAPVEKPALLRKLFVLGCEYGAQILSYQKIMGQLAEAGSTVVLAHYQKLLESAYLIVGLEKYSGSKIRKRGSSPKWLPLNTALITALTNRTFQETRSDAEAWGRLVESAVGAHLFQSADRLGLELYYWREGNNEVDYVLQKGKKAVAIEVKSGRKKSVLSGLRAFEKKYHPFRSLAVGLYGIPIEDFLKKDAGDWFTER